MYNNSFTHEQYVFLMSSKKWMATALSLQENPVCVCVCVRE